MGDTERARDEVPVWGTPAGPDELGDLLAVLRRRAGLTQGGLADTAQVTRRFVNELEGGHSTIYIRRLFAVLDALGAHLVIAEDGAERAPAAEPPPQTGLQVKDLGW